MRSNNRRTPGNPHTCGRHSRLKISPRCVSISSPLSLRRSEERKTGSIWSPPLPICELDAEVPQGLNPGRGMEVIGIDERPVNVEDHGLRHAIQIPFVVETPNARSIRKFERN